MEQEDYNFEFVSKEDQLKALEEEIISTIRKGKVLAIEKVIQYNNLKGKSENIDEVTL
jgi:hypothetical protein